MDTASAERRKSSDAFGLLPFRSAKNPAWFFPPTPVRRAHPRPLRRYRFPFVRKGRREPFLEGVAGDWPRAHELRFPSRQLPRLACLLGQVRLNRLAHSRG